MIQHLPQCKGFFQWVSPSPRSTRPGFCHRCNCFYFDLKYALKASETFALHRNISTTTCEYDRLEELHKQRQQKKCNKEKEPYGFVKQHKMTSSYCIVTLCNVDGVWACAAFRWVLFFGGGTSGHFSVIVKWTLDPQKDYLHTQNLKRAPAFTWWRLH